ncbi:hypothetical protein, partial [Pseudomonas khavaziana]|uniref:hypothetical protein n=1 Tax=Pseudomonas khavaziana TaxID=2842351 RepID=UPI001C3DAB34
TPKAGDSEKARGILVNDHGAPLPEAGVTNPKPIEGDSNVFRMHDAQGNEKLVGANLEDLTQVMINNISIDIVLCASSSGAQIQVLKDQKGSALAFDKPFTAIPDTLLVEAHSPNRPYQKAWVVMGANKAVLDPVKFKPIVMMTVIDVSVSGDTNENEYLVVKDSYEIFDPFTMVASRPPTRLTDAIGPDGTTRKFLVDANLELVPLSKQLHSARLVNIQTHATPILVSTNPTFRP